MAPERAFARSSGPATFSGASQSHSGWLAECLTLLDPTMWERTSWKVTEVPSTDCVLEVRERTRVIQPCGDGEAA